jgi:hypothetical protein
VTPGPWDATLFQRHKNDDLAERCPGEEFLDQCPSSVREDLSSVIDDDSECPPPQFSGGGMWKAMHDALAGYYEARRPGPNRRLYRLFCVLERDVSGLDKPSIIIVSGSRNW